MATSTPNLGLIKPAVNSAVDEDLWGDQWNSNADTLDSEAVLKTVNQNFNNLALISADIRDFSEDSQALGNVSGAVVVDYSNSHYQYATLTGNISGLTINNPPASGKVGFLTLELIQDATGSRTIDLTGGTYRSTGGITLTTTASAIDKLRLETRDGGTTWDVVLNANFTTIT